MTGKPDQNQAKAGRIIISVDAMGGDAGPAVVVAGIAISAEKNPDIGFILHGPRTADLAGCQEARLKGRVEIRDARDVVTMEDKPSQVMRNGKGTSMWSALEAVKNGEAAGCCFLRQYRRADGPVDAAPAQAAGRQPPRHCDPLALAEPARLQRDAGCRRRREGGRRGSAAVCPDGHFLRAQLDGPRPPACRAC